MGDSSVTAGAAKSECRICNGTGWYDGIPNGLWATVCRCCYPDWARLAAPPNPASKEETHVRY